MQTAENYNLMRLQSRPAIMRTYSDIENINDNLIGAENETSFL
jgi:hypothetical protein